MAAVTYLLVADYDEAKESLYETYGTSSKEVEKIVKKYIDEVTDKNPSERATFTEKTMELVQSGKITGGVLLALATERMVELVQATVAKSALRELLLRELRENEDDSPEGNEES